MRHLDFSRDVRFLSCTAENGVLAYETTEFQPFNQYRHYMASRAIWCGDGEVWPSPSPRKMEFDYAQ